MWDRCYGLCNTPFLSHVLRNFIEDELVDGKAGTAHNS